ncbi:hypothetical protein FZEAL_10213 [Fusarium zealandicum]|uniref:Protein SQS1 n=1 Tax=Fusarium zealandicum TaxID=1053134 RepID=A0A8H4XCU9_9HYPO|nr:hypothetical protein FZEAL_10213 [Fusarium zealandicum]
MVMGTFAIRTTHCTLLDSTGPTLPQAPATSRPTKRREPLTCPTYFDDSYRYEQLHNGCPQPIDRALTVEFDRGRWPGTRKELPPHVAQTSEVVAEVEEVEEHPEDVDDQSLLQAESISSEKKLATGFTLADEARQTSQHDHASWSNLRQRPVKFVSAGPSEPLKLLDELIDEADEDLEEPTVSPPAEQPSYIPQFDNHQNNDAELDEDDDEAQEAEENGLEDEDETGDDDFIGPDELDEAIQAGAIPKEDLPAEPAFFFDLKGDQPQEKPHQQPVEIPERPSSRSSSSSEEVILFKGRGAQKKPQPAAELSMVQMQTEIHVVEQTLVAEHTPALSPVLKPAEPTRRKKLSHKEKKQRHRDKRNAQNQVDNEKDAIIADYIANMKENNEVDDYFKELIQGGMDSDGSDSDSPGSSSVKIRKQPSISTKPKAADVDNPDEDEEEDLAEEDEDDDVVQSEVDDETLARLIAGRDLGMEDVYYGDSSSDSDSSGDRKLTKKQLELEDDFDVMDWDRPSVRRRKGKGARAQINFNVSDSELEASLQAAWNNDRLKKSERKKQREELRALGMLGKKANPDDLRIKYPDGMNMEQVAEELRTFMLSSEEQLMLPPMDNHARKMIHDLANKFKIKSKSTGKADQRRPTLYRTGRTLPYVEATFDQAINRVNRRYFPRLDMKGKKAKRLPAVRGGGNVAAATYQDGEIVGGSAPELGVANRGRTMLEKMGWSTGTALGATDNKGIMQPVTHAMKRSKAGLG